MRISTNTLYEQGVASMQQQTERLLRTQQQIASGRRMLAPSDDPVSAARALEVSQSQAVNRQQGVNVDSASDALALHESTLGNVYHLLQDVRDLAINAGNPSLSPADRDTLATNLRGRYQELLGLANQTDGTGQFIFAGYKGTTRPFAESVPGTVAYNGDQGQRLLQVAPARQMPVGESGDQVFQRIRTGNGTFEAVASATNQGTALIDSGTVLDPVKWSQAANNKDFTITFAVTAGVTTYDIIDNVAGVSMLTGLAPAGAPLPGSYSGGGTISLSQVGPPAFDFGAQVALSGAPADGDTFTIKASSNQDMFKTLDNLANLLANSNGGAALTNGLTVAMTNLDNAMENVLTLRTAAGSRMVELDSLKSAADDRNLQYSQTLSRLQDLDYAQAISDLTQQQVNLEAAQKSYNKVAGLSLFNFI